MALACLEKLDDLAELLVDEQSVLGGEEVLHHSLGEQLAGIAHVNSRLDLVAREDPHLDASSLHERDGRAHFFLKLVFNGSASYKVKVSFELLLHLL